MFQINKPALSVLIILLLSGVACLPTSHEGTEADSAAVEAEVSDSEDLLSDNGMEQPPSTSDAAQASESSQTTAGTVDEQPQKATVDPGEGQINPDAEEEVQEPAATMQPGAGNSGPITPDQAYLQAGTVTVNPVSPSFESGEAIEIIVANGLAQPIYTTDLKSNCTIIILEKWDGGSWQPLSYCEMEILPLTVGIEAGEGFRVILDPFSSDFGATIGGSEPGLESGTYRSKLTYRLQQGEGPETEVAYSPEFVIGP